MKPIDFVVYEGDSAPNTPVYEIANAMKKDIKIIGMDVSLAIRGYYYDEEEKRMVLEIEEVTALKLREAFLFGEVYRRKNKKEK